MWNLKKGTEKTWTIKYREQNSGSQRGGNVEKWAKQVKELRVTDFQLQDGNYRVGNIANNVTILYGYI